MSFKKDESSLAPLRILLVVRWPVGGIRTFLKYILRDLKSQSPNFNFSIVAANVSGLDSFRKEMSSIIDRWSGFSTESGAFSACQKAVISECRGKDIDVIHAHGFTSLLASVIPARIFNIPLVFTSHDVINSEQFVGMKGKIKRLLLALSLRQCRVVHSVSYDAESNLKAWFPFLKDDRRCYVIPNGIDVGAFKNAKSEDIRGMFGVARPVVFIGFFGRFMNQKGFRYLVNAVKLLNNESNKEYHVMCVGSGGFIREEKIALQDQGLSDYFHFVPFTPNVASYMKACDVVAMPSLWEACPLQPMEALTAGVPFVGSDCIGLREVLKDTPAVLVKTGDHNSLASGIKECLSKGPDPFIEFSGDAAERFDSNKVAGKIRRVYDEVVGGYV